MMPLLIVSSNWSPRSPKTVNNTKSARQRANATFFTAHRPAARRVGGRSRMRVPDGPAESMPPADPSSSSDAPYRLAFILALSTACAAASRATGTRYGEQLT